jgi:hypothetical protein
MTINGKQRFFCNQASPRFAIFENFLLVIEPAPGPSGFYLNPDNLQFQKIWRISMGLAQRITGKYNLPQGFGEIGSPLLRGYL